MAFPIRHHDQGSFRVRADAVMNAFPPEETARVTLANWRTGPFNRWAFHHVREIVPTALIARGRGRSWRLARAIEPVERIAFEAPGGERTTVKEMLARTYTDGFIVLRNGVVVHESYDAGHDPESPHIIFSASKSVTGLIAGILAIEGRLDPDASVTSFIPEAKDSAYGSASVRHVLDMTVGVDFTEDYLNPNAAFLRYREATGWNPPSGEACDLRGFLTTLKPDGKRHGDVFHYVSPNSDLLGWILERASGERFPDLASRLLWRPMGAESHAYVTVDRLGASRAAGGICLTLRDMARIGEIVRCRGMAEGRQVAPASWIDDIAGNGNPDAWRKGDFAVLLPGGRYRSKWYTAENGAILAIGIHGQWIYVDGAVTIAKQSSQPLPVDDPTDRLLLKGFEAIARAV